MTNPTSEEILKKIQNTFPKKLIEPLKFYSEVLSGNKNIKNLCSDDVKGSFTYAGDQGERNSVVRGYKSLVSQSSITFTGKDNIVFFGPHSSSRNADIRVIGNNCIFYFGAFSSVESMVVLLSGDAGIIQVGDHCMLSARIIIDRSDHHSIYDSATGLKINEDKDVIISDHVWIGRDVKVSKGSTIGENAIIGQASLVAGNLKSDCAYGGIPARCIREGVTWSRMNSKSIEEMEKSTRHQDYLKSVRMIRHRLGESD